MGGVIPTQSPPVSATHWRKASQRFSQRYKARAFSSWSIIENYVHAAGQCNSPSRSKRCAYFDAISCEFSKGHKTCDLARHEDLIHANQSAAVSRQGKRTPGRSQMSTPCCQTPRGRLRREKRDAVINKDREWMCRHRGCKSLQRTIQ